MPTVNDIAADLFSIAAQTAAAHGRKLKQGAAGDLKAMSKRAAEEIVNPKQFGVRSVQQETRSFDERMGEARSQMQRFVENMVKHAGAIQGYAPDSLGEKTFSSAWAALCPCWPFC